MSRFAFSITKKTPWRGGDQEFSNRYVYECGTPNDTELSAVIDGLKTLEAPVHAASVTFVEGRAWGPLNSGGTGGDMRVVKALSGNGSAGSTAAEWYREFAFLVIWPLGRYGARNRPQFLRKWIHSNSLLGAGVGCKDGFTAISPVPTSLTNYGNGILAMAQPGVPSPCVFTSPKGLGSPGTPIIYQYLEHHQFGR